MGDVVAEDLAVEVVLVVDHIAAEVVDPGINLVVVEDHLGLLRIGFDGLESFDLGLSHSSSQLIICVFLTDLVAGMDIHHISSPITLLSTHY